MGGALHCGSGAGRRRPAPRADLEASLALREELADESGRAWVLWQLGVLARYEGGQEDRAAEYLGRGLAAFTDLSDAAGVAHVRYSMGDRRCVASILYNLGALALSEKESTAAE